MGTDVSNVSKRHENEQAMKAFARSGEFKGHFPIDITYRGLSLKSARYRRGGRGRSWQAAWWINGDVAAVRQALESHLGSLADWQPELQA